jgi:hypothetical protein
MREKRDVMGKRVTAAGRLLLVPLVPCNTRQPAATETKHKTRQETEGCLRV